VALRFEDHAAFQRTCLIAAGCGALAAYYATWIALPKGFLPWAGAASLAAATIVALRAAERWEDDLPPVACIVAAVALAAGVALAAPSLVALVELLHSVLPAAGAAALGGAVLGLWMGAATSPLHLRAGEDPVTRRLLELEPRIDPESLRKLRERVDQLEKARAAF